ncbi:D-lactate dehydrogenase [Mycobacterium frederiksbergense]|uniref:D-lactate dehydrogenase (cytochrome) n=1 Tax=Mycolicibacterium frederiksbergense TaxID=117567 RepID=A0ABT6KVH5_9MYCO|nr:FAD-binding and (Fe-S)-binding domain-containing protein [Mycolicibacterium frederiksbergense]MDH6194715.1 D-lactate dehydrogenase [Mycolicibacterium frederiksbergense]
MRYAKAHDASHYLLVPEVVVTAGSAEEIGDLCRAAAKLRQPLTFRAGGTSLSGQAGSDSILVDTRKHFRTVTVLADGTRVRVQPGATVRAVNARLAPYGTRLGPDPASETACTIGGVVANNSSGMACGTEFNTYRTLESAVLVLPSGTSIDTGQPDADERLAAVEPDLHRGLLRLRDRVRSNPESVRRIEAQFAMKNTMGYGVNAFLDFDLPADILARLVIGSEGTLAFVAEATFRTVPVRPHAATGLIMFDDIHQATSALPALVAAGYATLELLDATSLRVAQRDPQSDARLAALRVTTHAALLVEHQLTDREELDGCVADSMAMLNTLKLAAPPELTTDPAVRAALWRVRKGLYATVAGNRPTGTTALLEDIAVPVDRLAEVCDGLIGMFAGHHYEDSVIFGHAKDGNVHFMLNERFGEGQPLDRYLAFTEEMVDLVLGAGGTLKAEHGTGRIMAPFVRRQYGDELYDVMAQLKHLCDPNGILNPGVVISEDPKAHVSHLKTTPRVEEEVDRCVECGFCEPVCPSKDLTLTPRTRIALRREQERARANGDTALFDELVSDYNYDGLDTCAADGMCQTACPVLIDTGSLVTRLRAERHGKVDQWMWQQAARHWKGVSRAGAAALTVAGQLPAGLPERLSGAARRMLGDDVLPSWSADLPSGGQPRSRTVTSLDSVVGVHFSACVGSMFGAQHGGPGAAGAMELLCHRAGIRLAVPTSIESLCCGTPWKSKGLGDSFAPMRERLLRALWDATDHGRLPVICEASSCTEGLERAISGQDRYPGLRVIDALAFTVTELLPRLPKPAKVNSAALHPTCSTTRLGTNDALGTIAHALAQRVDIPHAWGCCAFAGDRGMLHPELTASATGAQAAEVNQRRHDLYLSANRTCEIGMTRATGKTYEHVLEALERATRNPQPRSATERN